MDIREILIQAAQEVKMKKRTIIFLGFVFIFFSACTTKNTPPPTSKPIDTLPSPDMSTQTQPPTEFDGESLLQERCNICHNLDRIREANKTEEEWDATVQRMIGKGAILNSSEKEALVQYLTENYGK